jgi:hypothetical protein
VRDRHQARPLRIVSIFCIYNGKEKLPKVLLGPLGFAGGICPLVSINYLFHGSLPIERWSWGSLAAVESPSSRPARHSVARHNLPDDQ